MDGPLFTAIVLFLVALCLLVVEFFIPSGGLIAVTAGAAFLASIFVAFTVSAGWGFTMILIVAIVVPVVLSLTIRFWPRTPMGRRMMTRVPGDPLPDVLPDDEHHQRIRSLLGRVGVAETDLLPNGSIRIDGRRYDAVASGAIDANQTIEVHRIDADKLHVRATTRSLNDVPDRPDLPESPSSRLEQPIEELGIESLDDPLG